MPGASFVAAWLGQHPLVANLISLVLDLAKDIAVPDSTTKALRALVTFFVSTGFYTVVKENLCPTENDSYIIRDSLLIRIFECVLGKKDFSNFRLF